MKRKILTAVLAVVTIAGVTACQGENSGSALNDSIEKSGDDVTVLQAWLGSSVALKLSGFFGGVNSIDPSACHEISRQGSTGSDGHMIYLVKSDCTQAAEQALKLDGQGKSSPMINAAIHSYYDKPALNAKYTITGNCEVVEFRTITPDASLNSPAFKGIGFYYSRDRSELITKDRLHKVGSVTLKNGASASVHRFIAQGMCYGTGGNGGSIADRQYLFRPFAQFDGFDGNLYNVWDNVATDYLLGRNRQASGYVFVKDFDRQNDLLKQ